MVNFPASLDTTTTLLTAVNRLETTLNGQLAADANGNNGSATKITVFSTAGFPTAGLILIEAEVISYTGITATEFTGITRAADGTATAIHLSLTLVKNGVVAGYHNYLRDAIIAIENEMYEAGDMKYRFCLTVNRGRWLLLDGKTIGNAASGGSARANADTITLFTLLWDNLADADAAVSGGRGANAAADYAANKTIMLPDARGLALSVAGTNGVMTNANGVAFVRTLGHKENDMLQGHLHSADSGSFALTGGGNGLKGTPDNPCRFASETGSPVADGVNGAPRTGAETRAANIAAYLFIKY